MKHKIPRSTRIPARYSDRRPLQVLPENIVSLETYEQPYKNKDGHMVSGGFQGFAARLRETATEIGRKIFIFPKKKDFDRMVRGWKEKSGPANLFARILKFNNIRMLPEEHRSAAKFTRKKQIPTKTPAKSKVKKKAKKK